MVLQPGGVLCHFHWGDLGRALNFIDDEVNNKDDNSIDVSARRTIIKVNNKENNSIDASAEARRALKMC